VRRFAFGRLSIVLVTILVFVGVAGCGGAGGGTGDKVRISVGVDSSFAPMFVADQEGLFKAAGLDVKLVQTQGGSAGAENVAAGVTELSGNADSTALTMMAKNPDLRALAVYQQSGRYLKVVLHNKISDPHQIRRMATFPGMGTYIAIRYLESKGIDPKSVQLVNANPPEIPALLGQGQVDAYVAYPPWTEKGLENNGRIAGTTGDYGVSYRQWIIANNQWLAGHNELAGRIVKVIAQAAKIVADDPGRAARAVEQSISLPANEARTQISEIDFGARGFTADDRKQSEDIVNFFSQRGVIDGKVDLNTTILPNWYQERAQ
jgi:NitT/TauT family transport system substrate-binding protein